MKYYLDDKEISLEQLDKAVVEADNRNSKYDSIYWRITLGCVYNNKLCFFTERFEDC